MAIVNARVDERLIHGQVAMVWTNTVGAERIVVINDEVPKDEMQIAALKFAKPAGVKLSLLSKERAKVRLTDGSFDQEKIFIITKNVEDMLFLVEHAGLKEFNIGNVSAKEGGKAIKKSVSLTEEEIEKIKDAINSGVKVTAQMLPTESDESIDKLF